MLASVQEAQGVECGQACRLGTGSWELGAGGLCLGWEACDGLGNLSTGSGRRWSWGEVSADPWLGLVPEIESLGQHVLKLRRDGLRFGKYSLASLRGGVLFLCPIDVSLAQVTPRHKQLGTGSWVQAPVFWLLPSALLEIHCCKDKWSQHEHAWSRPEPNLQPKAKCRQPAAGGRA